MGVLRCSCCGGWTVEQVTVQRGGRFVVRLRVKHYGYLVADARTIEEVAAHVDLALLAPGSGRVSRW